ncbi:MAG: hypothetical protein WDO17_01710 [Alphaproteobacteria bacterium]
MADDQKSQPPNKRKRPPTTIELRATEVATEPAAKAEPIDPTAENTPAEAAEAWPQPEPESAPSPAAERPRAGGWRERLDLSGVNARLAALRSRAAERMNWRLIAAGAAGAAAMLAVFLALWGLGMFNTRDDLTVMLAARLAMLEQQVRDVANRPPPPGVDQRALAELAARVGAAEQAMGRLTDLDGRVGKAEAAAAAPRAAQPDVALAARVTALEGAAREAKSRADAAFELAQKAPAQTPTVAPAELQALAARVAALEQAAKAVQEKIAVTAGADRAGRLAFVAVALRGAVERGEPFAQELAAAKPLVPDAAALNALEPFAAGGVPRTPALARELSQLTGPMLSAAGAAPREGGILDRIQQNAERLVRIRPINETPGDDAATVVARADVKAAHGDLAGALAELGALPPAVRAPAEGWIKKAQAQMAALAAARKLADDAVGTLSKAAP